jgi:HAD superfamily hydrolase (TIGR01509 family)
MLMPNARSPAQAAAIASTSQPAAETADQPPGVLRALLFDMDGTLAETEALGHRIAYNRAFHQLGLKIRWTPELYRELLRAPGGGRDRLVHYREHYRPDLGPYSSSDSHEWARLMHAMKSMHFRKLLREGCLPLRIGVKRLFLEAVSAGINLCIVTNATHKTVAPVIRYTLGPRLEHCLEFVIGAEQIRRKKPDPESYLLALEKLRLPPQDCIAVEDSASGLKAAVAAGLTTLVVQNEDTAGQNFSAAALVVDSLGEPGGTPPKVLHGRLDEPYVSVDTLRRLLSESAERAVPA